jgi:nucleolar protein 53
MARAAEKRRRQKERKQKLEDDVERVLKNKSPTEQISELANEQLFYIDEKPDASAGLGTRKGKKAKKQAAVSTSSGKRAGAGAKKKKDKDQPRPGSAKTTSPKDDVYDLWGSGKKKNSKAPKAKRVRLSTVIEPAGCSYNPRYDDHQDVVAEIVATEIEKELLQSANADLQAASVHVKAKGVVPDQKGGKLKPNEVPNQKFVSVKKTLKEVRREERALEEKLKRKNEEKIELRKTLPPRLGKKRYQPESKKVLTTDEIDGSIGTLRSEPMLSNAVFNKMQRKGVIEPRDQAVKRRRRRYVRA